ncbi:TPA: hypothetical protein DIC40_00420 [Patescibacteria group bacterium]|nr:hypothetical protein [Candidatus Gracilibacteria bacterium]
MFSEIGSSIPSQRAVCFSIFREIPKMIKFIPIAHRNRVRLLGLIYVFIKNPKTAQKTKIPRIFAV